MNILVTGGAGFIGSNLIGELAKQKSNSITCLDNYFTGKKENHVSCNNVNYIEGDTCDAKRLLSDKVFDVVYHFGEYSRISTSYTDIEILCDTIFKGTLVIIQLVKKWGAKLIYSASSSGLGNGGDDADISPYSWMKSKIVEYIINYNKWFGIKYQIVHFFNVYGPNQISQGKYSTVIGIFETQYSKKRPLTVVKPGTQKRDFIHVFDVVDGLIKIMNTAIVNHKWYLNSNYQISILTLAQLYNCNYCMVAERPGERFSSHFIDSDTQYILGWHPKIKIKDYISELYG
jgi:UDP-glucose 4-epimerase